MSANYLMVKKGENPPIFEVSRKMTEKEYFDLVDDNEELIWFEETSFGKLRYEKHPDIFYRIFSYLKDYLIQDNYIKFTYPHYGYGYITFYSHIPYEALKYFYDLAQTIDCNIWDRDSEELIDLAFLEALRIKEANRGIKLTKEQRPVITSIEDRCRWFHIPTDDIEQIFKILQINPEINEGDITSIIDEVQRDCKIAIARFPGHTILWGMNVPYLIYPDLSTYESIGENFTANLFAALNKLSKVFGSAQFFEYNNDDEQIASLALSKKGKLVYAKFSSEGMGEEIFGTQKKSIEVNQTTILKLAKKNGMTPEDMLISMMKQKTPIQYFTQPHWYIESRLKMGDK